VYHDELNAKTTFFICLAFTLLATAITLFVLNGLISPIKKLVIAINKYKKDRSIAALDINTEDEVGQLINHTIDSMRNNEELLRQKQDLMFLFSHDLKNFALNPEALANEILESNPAPNIRNSAELILQTAQRQKQFLASFIMLMQEEEKLSKVIYKVKSLYAGELITDLKNMFAARASEKNITLNFSGEATYGHVRIQKEMVQQVLRNLVSNALKFTPTGGSVNIAFSKQYHHFKFVVSDTGIGFSKLQEKALFEKFSGAARLGTDGEATSGIGLYLSQQIIKKAGGEIVARSNGENQGASFEFELRTYRIK
jgi:signal transduction histidine kinase